MATVTAADEALSSCSQNAAYSATIMAAQIRSAKAQVESGNPAMVNVPATLCTSVTATGAARLTRGAGGYLPLLGAVSLIAALAILGATAFGHMLPCELLDAVDMPALARAEFRSCRRQIGVFPTR